MGCPGQVLEKRAGAFFGFKKRGQILVRAAFRFSKRVGARSFLELKTPIKPRYSVRLKGVETFSRI